VNVSPNTVPSLSFRSGSTRRASHGWCPGPAVAAWLGIPWEVKFGKQGPLSVDTLDMAEGQGPGAGGKDGDSEGDSEGEPEPKTARGGREGGHGTGPRAASEGRAEKGRERGARDYSVPTRGSSYPLGW
jgi:hypothetical protein